MQELVELEAKLKEAHTAGIDACRIIEALETGAPTKMPRRCVVKLRRRIGVNI